jgi:hypothetical protein
MVRRLFLKMILNWAKSRVALWLAGSITEYPSYFMIGSGSGTVTTTQTALINPWDRQIITDINGDTTYKTKWTGDWNSIELSGNKLFEWGLCISGASTTGSVWSRTSLTGSLSFNGTTELRIEETWEVF